MENKNLATKKTFNKSAGWKGGGKEGDAPQNWSIPLTKGPLLLPPPPHERQSVTMGHTNTTHKHVLYSTEVIIIHVISSLMTFIASFLGCFIADWHYGKPSVYA